MAGRMDSGPKAKDDKEVTTDCPLCGALIHNKTEMPLPGTNKPSKFWLCPFCGWNSRSDIYSNVRE